MWRQRRFKNLACKKTRLMWPMLSGLLLLLISAAGYAHADDQIRAVRLSNVVGSVQILAGSETQFSQAYMNMPLMEGSTLKTGEDGRAEIQLEDGSLIRLTPNTSVAMTMLRRDPQGNSKTQADLLSGLSYVEMKGTANQLFVVHFNGNEVISPAPVSFRVNLDASPVEFAVLDGSAHLSKGTEYAVDVHMNETVRFDPGDSTRYFLAQGVEPDSWDQWNTDRDQAMNQMAARETREAIGSGNASAAGLSDLDYYGNWYSSNGSSFWVPDGAGAGWDPYGSGYWGFYGSTGGYVWISGYPWGWLPYRCGSWNYYNTFSSWGWTPGGCFNNAGWYPYYPYSGIGNVPPRYRRLPRPNPPGAPGSGGGFRPMRERPLIAVDRGSEATTLNPRLTAPRAVDVPGGTARLLPKTPSSTAVGFNRTDRPTPGAPIYGHPSTALNGGGQLPGNTPVYRPLSPVVGNRPTSSSNSSFGGVAAPRSTLSAPAPRSSFSTSAPRSGFSSASPSMGSSGGSFHGAPSAPAPSGGVGAAGGGHPR